MKPRIASRPFARVVQRETWGQALDRWAGVLAEMGSAEQVTVRGVAAAGGLAAEALDRAAAAAIGSALRRAGWVPRREGGGIRERVYRRIDAASVTVPRRTVFVAT